MVSVLVSKSEVATQLRPNLTLIKCEYCETILYEVSFGCEFCGRKMKKLYQMFQINVRHSFRESLSFAHSLAFWHRSKLIYCLK